MLCAQFSTTRISSGCSLLGPALGGEEVPHGAPDIVEIVQRVTARRAARGSQLREEAPGLGGQLPRQARGDFHIPGKARVLGNRRETLARVRGVTDGVVP